MLAAVYALLPVAGLGWQGKPLVASAITSKAIGGHGISSENCP
jgi:hypothetical protein